MRTAVIGAIVLLGISAAPASAEKPASPPWYGKAEAVLRSLLAKPGRPDGDVIAPPGNIDPQMAVVPPGPRGAMPVIRPREPSERQ